MDESIRYNLRNPAFTDDIGYSMINRMYPGVIDPLTGTVNSQIGDVNINLGQPQQDSYENTQKSADKEKFKKILIYGAGIALLIFGFKKGKALINLVKGLFSKSGNASTSGKSLLGKAKNLGANILNKVKNLGTKAKSGLSNPLDKVKNAFGKVKDFTVKIFKKIKK